jgi:dolichol-phosphate mannosyltransferase
MARERERHSYTRQVRVLIILPTYQEAENIETVLRRIRDHVPEASVLVVDDGSPDGTADLAEALGDSLGNVRVHRRPAKLGLGSAYLYGFDLAVAENYDAAIEMDSDLSHDPASLPALIAGIEEGADLVIGSRYVPGGSIPNWSLHRRLLSRWGNRYAAAVLGIRATDSTSGFRCYRSSMLEKIDRNGIRSEGYSFQIELVYRIVRAGGEVREVPIAFRDRVLGESKMSSRIVVEALALVTLWGVRDRALGRGRAKAVGR